MQKYIKDIQALVNPTFQQIRGVANGSLQHLSGKERNNIYKELNRGKKVIETQDELAQYLFSFGNMHEEKIHRAVENLNPELLNKEFEIIDWGCGQGLATITFFDFLNKNEYYGKASKVTLIEPSKIALERALIHTKAYKNQVDNIITLCKCIDDVEEEEIQSKSGISVIHFFSNILDVDGIDLLKLSNKIKNCLISDNIIVSVGPVYANNVRLDHFYKKYFKSPTPIFDKNESEYYYGNNQKCSFKAKVYKLEYNKQGNLIPIEFYPSVQFHSSYQLDCVTDNITEEGSETIFESLNVFDTSTPFDIGASVYDDIHPIIAVLNNIVTRGLPTKASPFVESIFQKVFNYSEKFENYGAFSFPKKKEIDIGQLLSWYNSVIKKQNDLNYTEIDIEQLQLIFSPVAIARVQKTILEALLTDKLDIKKKEWKILVEEKDVPCSAIAFEDLTHIFNNLTKLSRGYQDLSFPKIELEIISNDTFFESKLHLESKANKKEIPEHLNTEYDLVIDVAIFGTSNIEKESFSKFKCQNNCYFNIRSVSAVNSERSIYTTDRIVYRDIVLQDGQGNYSEIDETKELLEYFLQLIFRKKTFRPGQLPILNRALQNKSVIGLLPTGGGKSLTYQLATMLQPGVTLIVDPLRSLMKDQYDGLINVGIDTCAFENSTLSKEERDEVERKMEQSRLLYVFLSPERLAIYQFREKLKNMHELNVYFTYGVIDEVHCVSEWGHDFRFSYLHLGRNLYNYVCAKKNKISLFGLTATASFDVLADVERELSGNGAFPLDSETIVRYENSNRLELQYKIEKVNVEFQNELEALKKSRFVTPEKLAKFDEFTKNNLPYPVKVADKWACFYAKQNFLKDYIKDIPKHLKEIQSKDSIQSIKNNFAERQGNNVGCETELETNISDNYFSINEEYTQAGIVFCPHKNSTPISVYENKQVLNDLVPDVGTFSGGDDEDRNNLSMENLELFRTNKQPIMIATKAFGMGIDKPNVRFTVNLNYSSSLESFVQEAGRSGRDRKMALSVILLSDYKLARISPKFKGFYPWKLLKNRWFKPEDLEQIINHYNLNIDKHYIDYLTPENDLVRIFCKEGSAEHGKYFDFFDCKDGKCILHEKCPLKGVPKEAENWIYKDDLLEIMNNNNISIDKKYIEYHNADYETVMYFYNNSFKGEFAEKKAMVQCLSVKDVEMFIGDDAELKPDKTITVKGFLTSLLNAKEDEEIVYFVKYVPDQIGKNIAKCIENAKKKKEFKLKCISNKFIATESDCYDVLKDFYKTYYNVKDFTAAKNAINCAIATLGVNPIQKTIYKTLEHLSKLIIHNTYSDLAKAIYRMTCIGLIDDFTQDYKNNRFRIVAKRKPDGQYYQGLKKFLKRYYSEGRAEEEIKKVPHYKGDNEIHKCLGYLTEFVYDKISVKRKRAIDDMRTFCITGIDESKDWKETNEELKDFIYYYFNSKYAKTDYKAYNGEDYSITNDTDEGKESKDWILFKYLKVIDDKVEQGTPIDNVKHLQGAVRLLRRSLTDSNPALSLLNAFCIFFLGTNNNEKLEKEVVESYKEGMIGFAEEREKKLVDFWELFEEYNQILKPFSNSKLDELKDEITFKIHSNKLKKITTKYLG